MNSHRFATVRRQPRHIILLLLFVSLYAGLADRVLAQQSEASDVTPQMKVAPDATGVLDAVVKNVQGTILEIEGGITIDISKAHVFKFDLSDNPVVIQPGMCIRVSFTTPADITASLAADFVRVRVPEEIVITGVIQAVDRENGVITVVNRRIKIDSGPFIIEAKRKLKIGKSITVIAKPSGTELVAVQIFTDIPLGRIFP